MKESWKNRPPRSEAHCKALSAASIGRRASLETKRKMSEQRKGKVPQASYIPFICEHCGKSGKGAANYKRWHSNNCKQVPK